MINAQLADTFFETLRNCPDDNLTPALALLDELKVDPRFAFMKKTGPFAGNDGKTHLGIRIIESGKEFWDVDMYCMRTGGIPPMSWAIRGVPEKESAIWQVFLLHMAGTQLPLYGHYYYSDFGLVASRDQWERIKASLLQEGELKSDPTVADNIDFSPHVELMDDGAIITYYIWHNWTGLIRKTIVAHQIIEGCYTFEGAVGKTIVKYDCGIRI